MDVYQYLLDFLIRRDFLVVFIFGVFILYIFLVFRIDFGDFLRME